RAGFGATPQSARVTRALSGHRLLGGLDVPAALLTALWQIGVEETKHVRMLDCTHAFLLLQVFDVSAEFFHLRPMNFGAKMVLGVIAVVEEKPVIDFSVAAHAPRDRFIRVRSVMPVVTVQVTETMSEVPERREKQDEPPV